MILTFKWIKILFDRTCTRTKRECATGGMTHAQLLVKWSKKLLSNQRKAPHLLALFFAEYCQLKTLTP